jgi:serine/threonine protein kinase
VCSATFLFFFLSRCCFFFVAILHKTYTHSLTYARTHARTILLVDYKEITRGKQLGSGELSDVFAGRWRAINVAVKRLRSQVNETEFTAEMGKRRERVCTTAHVNINRHCSLIMCMFLIIICNFTRFRNTATLVNVRHPSLVLFMGVAWSGGGGGTKPTDRACIVSERMTGTLFDLLHDSSTQLSWRRRIDIAISVARGLAYLHTHKPQLLHNRLNSHNVLVDDNLVAKISDFGMVSVRK